MKIATAERAKIVRRVMHTVRSGRELLARQAGYPLSSHTLKRDIVKFKRGGKRALERKPRNDRGKPRALPKQWAQFAAVAFFTGEAVGYSQLCRDIAQRCARRGIPAPSYTWVRRWIDRAFRRATSSGRIRRLGDFVRLSAATTNAKEK